MVLSPPNLTLAPAATTIITRPITVRHYIRRVFDPEALSRIAADAGGVVTVDFRGRTVPGPPVAGSRPVLLVSPVAESVKVVEGERVGRGLDRVLLWAVEGMVLDLLVLASIPDAAHTVPALIEAVSAAGHDWLVVESDPL